MEDLVVIGHICRLRLVVKFAQDLVEVSRSIEVDSLQSIAVILDDLLDSIDSWVENVTVQGEAVWGFLIYRWNVASKAIKIDHLVRVVELEDISNVLDDGKVGISLRV